MPKYSSVSGFSAGDYRGVAQPGSASALGAEGRRFESVHPDQRGQTITRLPKDYVPEEPTYAWLHGIDHVAYKRDSNDWWFVDETENFNGPYDTMNQAVAALNLYFDMLA